VIAFATQGDGPLDAGRAVPCCQGAKQVLVTSKTIRPRGCEAAKQLCEVRGEERIAGYRTHDLDLAVNLLFYLASQEGWVEMEHPPPHARRHPGAPRRASRRDST
jgi:hypothetical protein